MARRTEIVGETTEIAAVGRRLRAERDRLDLDQQGLADRLGISRQQLSAYEGGGARASAVLVGSLVIPRLITPKTTIGETVLAAKEIAAAVNAAMEALPEELRQAVTLREIEGLSYEEIAELMNCPIGTVRSRLARGRRLLQGALHRHALDAGLLEATR
jgi:DNA-directed RNA polymerase specialized sigma24 family protein